MLVVWLKKDFDIKFTEIEGKIPNISGLATNSELTAVKNKIPDVSSFVKKQILIAKLLKSRVKYLMLVAKLKKQIILQK